MADPTTRTVTCWRLTNGQYDSAPRSVAMGVDMVELALTPPLAVTLGSRCGSTVCVPKDSPSRPRRTRPGR